MELKNRTPISSLFLSLGPGLEKRIENILILLLRVLIVYNLQKFTSGSQTEQK